MDVSTAYSTIQIICSKLNTCMTKVAQLEGMCDDDEQTELVLELQTNLRKLNQEKDILIKYIKQEVKKAPVLDLATV